MFHYEERPLLQEEIVSWLCYRAHGGSGYSFTKREVEQMPLQQALHYLKELGRLRKEEADSIRNAGAKG